MIAQSGAKPGSPLYPPAASPQSVGGANTQALMLFVDSTDAHCERARQHGAVIVDKSKVHDYGADYRADRSYGALDREGHLWWFTERVRAPQA